MGMFDKPDFSGPGAGARSGARIGAAFGPIGMGLGALGGWFAGRQAQGRLTDLGNKGADFQRAWNDQRGAAMWGTSSSPMSQFTGGLEPMTGDDTITDDLGITDYGSGDGGGAGNGVEIAHGGGGGPMGMRYSAAGGGSGGGVWQGGGGMHSYQVNSGSLSPSNYQGIDSGQGRKKGTSPRN